MVANEMPFNPLVVQFGLKTKVENKPLSKEKVQQSL